MDARCPKCRLRIGWQGKAVDRPPCPKCGHVVPREELEKADAQWRQAVREMHAALKVERIRTVCPCGRPLLLMIQLGEHGVYARNGQGQWKRVERCPECDRSFRGLSAAQIKEGIWQS